MEVQSKGIGRVEVSAIGVRKGLWCQGTLDEEIV